MDALEVISAAFAILFWLALAVLSGFFIYWTGRILRIIPSCLLRITAALEKIANK